MNKKANGFLLKMSASRLIILKTGNLFHFTLGTIVSF